MTKHFRLLFFITPLISLLAASPGHAAPRGNILFFGDSLTAGYGLDDPTVHAYPALIQEMATEAGLAYRVINAGLSGETSAGGVRRVDWILRQPVAVFVLELGGNDGLRGLPLATLRENLQSILDKVRAKNPDAHLVLAGMQMPPSMGEYAADFAALFPTLADSNNITLIPHLLEGVGGIPRLNLPDGIHPNPEGHRIVAQNVWTALEPLLKP